MIRLNQQQKNEMVKRYLSGQTLKRSVDNFTCTVSVLKTELQKRNIPIRTSGSYHAISKKDENLMIKGYADGLSAREAGNLIGVTPTTCYKSMKKRGIKTRDAQSYTRLPLNENYFGKIDTEDKAYWLGFITADGYVHAATHSLGITLQYKDINHLQKFLDCLKSKRKITIRNRTVKGKEYKQAAVNLINKTIIFDLEKCGIHQNKTFTIKPYTYFGTIDLERAYWRGVFDGDGSIYKIRSSNLYSRLYGVDLVGNVHIITGFKNFLDRNDILLNTDIKKRGSIYSYRTRKKDKVEEVCKLLYKDAKISLDRKYNLYREIVEK